MAKLANIYAKYGENTVFRLQDDSQSLASYRVRVYVTRYAPTSAAESCVGEVPGEAAGEVMSIPVYTADLAAESQYNISVRKVDSGGIETELTLDRDYDLRITPQEV